MTRTNDPRRRIAAALAAALIGATLLAGGGAASADDVERDVNPAAEEVGMSTKPDAPALQVITPRAGDEIAIAPNADLNQVETRDDRA